ncbi:ABC-ATPase domain-containing protein [Lacicoccus alkaliphilus]|uniref:Predicted ATPase of the ABC class n=1 Tax=Lacicoccus alkaliphilus DSM 16010 TaxID=1123231 RepID=A0A1M7CWY5_9BACL|nr:ABC-ATPase domain-containing protein [Salinicoccus alkaliphilus]SHL71762.1 Predicted ATPase of the ABC class [Salinicoccus alkaliphilus DSM 16010]
MKTNHDLNHLLHSLDRQTYGRYKQIKGIYDFGGFRLAVDHVQVDPFAPPSKMRIIIDRKTIGILDDLLESKPERIAASDFLIRTFDRKIGQLNKKSKGQGTNGKVFIDRCGQEMFERTAVVIGDEEIEVRIEAGLPAAGRKILGKAAASIFSEMMPEAVESLLYKNLNQQGLKDQIILMLDQEHILEVMKEQNLIAFVADGSVLPRESGVSDRPMQGAVPFESPESLETEIELPSGDKVTGMGLPEGITLIVGGGYHGKSTLLEALERGVYHHIEGDGRELVLTRPDAVKIRAEDGRSVSGVDIAPFINNLPGGKDTHKFSTANASGSTSQAANVMEALEAGSSLMLIDEDTSATNFMIRDARMQKLIAPDKEPITPFSDKIRALYGEKGVSTILIVGGSGDYFEAADHVLMMDEYRLKDVTREAKTIADTDGYRRPDTSHKAFGVLSERTPLKKSFAKRGKDGRLKSKGLHTILYGKESIDISGLEQLTDTSQTNAITAMIEYFKDEVLDDRVTISEAADKIYARIEKGGLDAISPFGGHPGNMALPRKQEFIAAVNRYRGLKVK